MLSPTIFQAFSVEVKRPFPTILLMILIIEFFAQVFQQGSKDVLKYIYVMDENKPTFFSTSLSCLWSDSILSMAILKVTGLPSAKSEYWLESWELDATNRHRSLKANGCTVNTLCNYSQGRGKGGGGGVKGEGAVRQFKPSTFRIPTFTAIGAPVTYIKQKVVCPFLTLQR